MLVLYDIADSMSTHPPRPAHEALSRRTSSRVTNRSQSIHPAMASTYAVHTSSAERCTRSTVRTRPRRVPGGAGTVVAVMSCLLRAVT